MAAKMNIEAISAAETVQGRRGVTREKVQELLAMLDDDGAMALYLRFWENCLIEEIARYLGKSWDQTNQIIEKALSELRLHLDPNFNSNVA